jgi:hypothetical protein
MEAFLFLICMKIFVGLFLVIFSYSALATPFDKVMGKEIIVSDSWVGQSFTLDADKNRDLIIRHKIFGSGVAVVSEKMYPVEKLSESKIRFFIKTDKVTNEFTLLFNSSGGIQLLLNGYELKIELQN